MLVFLHTGSFTFLKECICVDALVLHTQTRCEIYFQIGNCSDTKPVLTLTVITDQGLNACTVLFQCKAVINEVSLPSSELTLFAIWTQKWQCYCSVVQ